MEDVQPSDMVLNFSPFWIRLCNLSFGYRSDDKIRAIANAIGDVMEVEEHFMDLHPSHRVRV